jgi:hypothetical protein
MDDGMMEKFMDKHKERLAKAEDESGVIAVLPHILADYEQLLKDDGWIKPKDVWDGELSFDAFTDMLTEFVRNNANKKAFNCKITRTCIGTTLEVKRNA